MSVVDVLLANTNVAKQQIMRKPNFSKTVVDALNLRTLYELLVTRETQHHDGMATAKTLVNVTCLRPWLTV